jgi:hypothetical protein
MNGIKMLHVFIIESVSIEDIFHGRSEGVAVQKALAAAGIPTTVQKAVDRVSFLRWLTEARKQLCQEKSLIPVLHISAHGDEKGIYLTNEGEFLTWEELIEILAGINKALEGRLILCMSSCEGLRAWKMNLIHDPPAFSVLVGTEEKPTWEETAVGFTAFYFMLSKGKTAKEAVNRMKAVSDFPHFMRVPGKKVQQIRKRITQMTYEELIEFRAAMGLPQHTAGP